MELNREQLHEALKLAASVCPSRTPKPIYQCVELYDNGGVYATNGEVSVLIGEHGERFAALPADRLARAVGLMSGDIVDLYHGDKGNVAVKNGFVKYQFAKNDDEMPSRDVSGNATGSVKASDLATMLRQTAACRAAENSRYALTGAKISFSGEVRAAATDGHRLAIVDINAGDGAQFDLLLPSKACDLLARLCERGDGENVTVHADGGAVRFQSDGWTLNAALLEGNFPPIDDIIPKTHASRAIIDVADMKTVLQQASVTLGESSAVRISVDDGGVCVSSVGEQGSANASAPATLDGDPILIALQPAYVLDFLRVCGTDEFTFDFIAKNKPALLTAGAFRTVIMPLNLE